MREKTERDSSCSPRLCYSVIVRFIRRAQQVQGVNEKPIRGAEELLRAEQTVLNFIIFK